MLDQSWGLILSYSDWNYDASSSTNESTRNLPITEWIHCDELLFTTTCPSITDWPFFHNYNDRLELVNQKPSTNYITSSYNVWNVEIANLPVKNYTFFNVNITASTQFMNLKLWEFLCVVLLNKYEVWPNIWLGLSLTLALCCRHLSE